jgi:hypothetical protein
MDILISNGYADISILVLTIKRTSELEWIKIFLYQAQ